MGKTTKTKGSAIKEKAVKEPSAAVKKIMDAIYQNFTTDAIRIRGLLKKRTETPKKFLEKFLTDWNHEKETIIVGSEETHTDPGTRRSFGDIFRIMQYYYPGFTVLELRDILYADEEFAEKVKLRSSYCGMIEKRTYYSEAGSSRMYSSAQDEFGMTKNDWINLK